MVDYHAFSADWVVREQIAQYSLNHVSQRKFTHICEFTGSKNLKQLHQVHSPFYPAVASLLGLRLHLC